MDNEPIKLTDFPLNKENPFLSSLIIRSRKKSVAIGRTRDKRIIDEATGALDDTLFIGITKDLDKEEFIKIYQSQLQSIFDLSKTALRMLSYFMNITTFHDKLLFDLKECKDFTGFSAKKSIFDGLAELLKNEIIARGNNEHIYYANPQIFYKGDRIVLVTEYRMKKKKGMENRNQIDLFDNEKV
jgi:hypothetical protein